jgi:nephrocystin-3
MDENGIERQLTEQQAHSELNRTNDNRTIRVFVSSTFRDMKAERDELVLRVFPQLKKFCEKRSVNWEQVELRWGIPEEQVANDKVLPICMEQIDRCRPFFIGLLGQRYGWVNTKFPDEVVDRHTWLREHIKLQKSITEIEILHGVLNNPQLKNHAFFYFRDPSYPDRLPVNEVRSDFVSADYIERDKLENLKERIRNASKQKFCSLRKDDFYDAKQLGQWVLEDFKALIGSLYPEHDKPDELIRMRMDHDAIVRKKANVYIRRKTYFDRLNSFVASNDSDLCPLIVLGESGVGKSALLANWVQSYGQNNPDDFLFTHFIGAVPNSANHVELLLRIMLELKNQFGLTETVPTTPEQVVNEFPDWLAKVSDRGRIIVVLDALEKIEDHGNAMQLEWLPRSIPRNFRLIVSTLPGPCLDALEARNWTQIIAPIKVQPLTKQESRNLVHQYLLASSHELDQDRLDRIVAAKQTYNPLFMRAMLDELIVIGEHERLDEQIGDYLTALNPKELYKKIIDRWIGAYSENRDLVARSLRFIWASRSGLSESELLALLGERGEPLPQAYLISLLIAAESALVTRSGLMTFDHEWIRLAVEDELCQDADTIRRIRHSIATYFEPGLHSSKRVLAEKPWQLAKGEYTAELKDFLLSPLMLRSQNAFREARRYWFSLGNTVNIGEEVRSAFMRMIREKPEPAAEGLIASNLSRLLSDLGYHNESHWFINHAEKYYLGNWSSHKDWIILQKNRATTLIKEGRLEEAKLIQKKILSRASELGMRNSDEALAVASNYAFVFQSSGDYERAYELYRDTAERTALTHGKRNYYYIMRRTNEFCSALDIGNNQVQESDLRDMIDTARSVLGPSHEVTRASISNLGKYFEKKGKLNKALKVFSELLRLVEKREGKESSESIAYISACARVQVEMKNYAKASSLYSKCFERASRRHEPLNNTALNCLKCWMVLSLESDNIKSLEGAIETVVHALAAHLRTFKEMHNRHEELLTLFINFMQKRGMPINDIMKKFQSIRNEILQMKGK